MGSGLRLRDVARDSLRATFRRGPRVLLTAAALALGSGALVCVLGLAQSGAAQVALRLGGLSSDIATVTLANTAWQSSDSTLPTSVNGVKVLQAVGTFTAVQGESFEVSNYRETLSVAATVVIATEYGLKARGAHLSKGAFGFGSANGSVARTVALGVTLARKLAAAPGSTVLCAGHPFTVTAEVSDNSTGALLSTALVLTAPEAKSLGLLPDTQDLLARGMPHFGPFLPALLPALLKPDESADVSVSVPPAPASLQAGVSADTAALVGLVGLATLAVSVLSMITTMQVAVRERRAEIGVLRAMGMRRSTLAARFMAESLIVSVVAAIVGWIVGVVLVAAVTFLRGWDLYLPVAIWGVPLVGLVVGVLAGVLPARTATRMEPATLIRSE